MNKEQDQNQSHQDQDHSQSHHQEDQDHNQSSHREDQGQNRQDGNQHQSTNMDHNPFAADNQDYAPYPKLDPKDVTPPPDPLSYHPAAGATTMPAESNPYVTPSPAQGSSSSSSQSNNRAIETVKDVLGKWGKKAADATTKAGDMAGNMWQHLKTSPNVADAAMARITRETKVIAEGGYEKVFRQTFETSPDEQLKKSYACYLSTSTGPIMGTLYLSTDKLAFSSDNPLAYKTGAGGDDDKAEWSYYKVIVPLYQVKDVSSSTSKINHGEKYIKVESVDGHQFWFMGFVNYESAVKNLQLLAYHNPADDQN